MKNNFLTAMGLPVVVFNETVPPKGTVTRIQGFLKIGYGVYHNPTVAVNGKREITGVQMGSRFVAPWKNTAN